MSYLSKFVSFYKKKKNYVKCQLAGGRLPGSWKFRVGEQYLDLMLAIFSVIPSRETSQCHSVKCVFSVLVQMYEDRLS